MILSCHNLSKSFSEQTIIHQASFLIEEHQKAAVVGINGAGKSTLLKMIIGELAPDEGEVIISKGITIGYLAQQKMIGTRSTIIEELRDVKRDVLEAEETLRSLEIEMQSLSGDALDEVMMKYHRLSSWFEQQNGYALQSEITGVLKGLGFTEEEFNRDTDTLSGGQKTRVALGKLLLSSPDLILLDEPTNHLDLNSIRWLETYLTNYPGAVIVVAHDRYFLDKIAEKVIEIDAGRVTSFSGNYSAYAEKKEMLREAALKAWMNQQQEIAHQKAVIAKLRQFNREKSIKRAESREKMLEKTEVLEKPSEVRSDMRLILEPATQSGNDVLTVENLSKSFDKVLFKDLSFEIKRGEHVALIGDNGTGKTTLLKILNDMLPADTGVIRLGSKVTIGYYDQEHQVLNPEKTLFDELQDTYPNMNNTKIRNVLAAFLFTGDDVFKMIRDISGGERGRVSLAKLMLSNANFLILDEPTNHLDIVSKEILEDALNAYPGTVFYVSHDRYFINKTASRILELKGDTLINYIGNYDYYLEKKEALEQIYISPASSAYGKISSADNNTSASFDETGSKTQWELQKQQQAQERKRQADLKKTEDQIAVLEEEDNLIDKQLADEAVFTDVEKCTALSGRKARIMEELEVLYERWSELAEG